MKMFSRWLGLGSVRSLFQRRFRTASPAVCRRRTRLSSGQQPETLEPRLALAVSAFAAEGLDQATIIISETDDLYLTQVTTSPTSLLYGTSSSYLGDERNAGVISDFSSKSKLMIAEGKEIEEVVIRSDGSPTWGQPGIADETFFLPKHVPHYQDSYPTWNRISGYIRSSLDIVDVETRGTIQITQADGAVSSWGFTNWNQQTAAASIRFDNTQMTIVSGPGKGGTAGFFGTGRAEAAQSITPGYYYPTSIVAEFDPSSNDRTGTTGFRVRWNRPIAASANPILNLDSYQTEVKTTITSEVVRPASYAPRFRPPTSAADDAAGNAGDDGADGGGGGAGGGAAASNQYEVTFTLGDAEGRGLVPGALFGTAALVPYGTLGRVEFAATDISVSASTEGLANPLSAYEGSYRLRFKQNNRTYADSYTFDNQNVGQQSALITDGAIGPLFAMTVEGFYNSQQGTVTFLFSAGGFPAKPGDVQLEDVRYAVYDTNEGDASQQSRVFIEPGLDMRKLRITVLS